MALSDLAKDLLAIPAADLDRLLATAHPADLDVLEAALDEIEAADRNRSAAAWRKDLSARYFDDPVAWAMDCVDWPTVGGGLTGYQAESLAMIPEKGRVAVRGPHGLGKDLGVETPLPTPTGWTTMGQVEAGDVVLDERGAACRVVYAEEPRWREAFLVRFADGASIVAGAGHLWNAVDVYRRPKRREGGRRLAVVVDDWRDRWDATRTVETRQMAATLRSPGGQLRWRVPTARPLDLPEADLPVDPYLFGYWLGDGATRAGKIYVGQADAAETLPRLGSTRAVADPRTGCLTVHVDGLRDGLARLGALGRKHIPVSYLRASIGQRRALVQGLWDSDGYRQAGGSDEITLTDKTLALDVAELVRSLGLVVRVREDDARLNGRFVSRRWRLGVRFDFNPYRLTRYGWEPRGRQASRHTQRTVVGVDPVGVCRTRCIAVDSPSSLFLAGEDMIPTHNTSLASIAVLWFSLTRDGAGVDWKVPTTASVWRQLSLYLWPEIHKWARHLRWDRIGRDPFVRGRELLQLSLKLGYGEAFALASDDPSSIEGAHASELLYLFDESKAVPDATFDAAEGAFSTAGLKEGTKAYALAISTPGEPVGRFYDIHSRRPGTEAWWVRHVTLEEAIAAGRVTRSWAESAARLWGGSSAVYQNRVLGEFAAADEDGVVPLAWVEAANERWRVAFGGRNGRDVDPVQGTRAIVAADEKLHTVGVDVARGGTDRTVLALRQGNAVMELRRYPHSNDTMVTSGYVTALQGGHGDPRAIIDVIGIGAGVFDRVRELGKPCSAFNASEGTHRHDLSGEFGFTNCLTGDAKASAIGRLRRIYRSRHDGPLYRVQTASGDQFTATPNHRVLTRIGWVAVHALNVGDQLCDPYLAQRVSGRHPQEGDMPAALSEIYRSARARFGSERVVAGRVNFHGDRPMGEIEVVTIDSDLRDGPSDRQHRDQSSLVRGLFRQGQRSGLRRVSQPRRARNDGWRDDALSRPTSPGSARTSPSALLSEVPVGLSLTSTRHGFIAQNTIHDPRVHSEISGDRSRSFASSIAVDDLSGVDFFEQQTNGGVLAPWVDAVFGQNASGHTPIDPEVLGDRVQRLATEIALDQVVNVEVIAPGGYGWSPFVYTLETSTGAYRTDHSVARNCRSWAWWNLREMLDPNLGCDVALPPDDRLTGDLTAPRWRVMSGGRIQVESKDDIRKRIGRSTDDGDAVVQAMSESGGSWADVYRPPPEADPDDVPQPRQKPSRSGGWGAVYARRDDDGNPLPPPEPRRGGYFGSR